MVVREAYLVKRCFVRLRDTSDEIRDTRYQGRTIHKGVNQ